MYTGPNITTTGLVYGYDTGIGVSTNNIATRLYPGQPTSNNFGGNFRDFTGTGYSPDGQWSDTSVNKTYLPTLPTPIGPGATLMTESTTNGWQGLSRYGGGDESGTHSLSAYIFPLTSNITQFTIGLLADAGNMVYFDLTTGGITYGGGISNRNATLQAIPEWPGWFRVGANFEGRPGGWVGSIGYSTQQIYQGSGVLRSMYITGIQYEYKSSPTPFTPNSRSTTQALIDAKRATTIDLSTVSFNSSAQPTFDGTDDEINTGITSQLTDFSCVVVFKNNNSEAWGRIVDKSYSDGFFISSYFATSGAGYVGAGIIEPNPPHGQAFQYDTSKYNYFAVTRSGSTHTVYLNGSGTSLSKTGSSSPLSSAEMAIGAWYGSYNSQRFTGEIPVVKLYNRALTANEIQQDFNAYRTRFGI